MADEAVDSAPQEHSPRMRVDVGLHPTSAYDSEQRHVQVAPGCQLLEAALHHRPWQVISFGLHPFEGDRTPRTQHEEDSVTIDLTDDLVDLT